MNGSTDPAPTSQPAPADQPGSITLPGFFTPAQIVEQLSVVRHKQPVAALAAANQYREELTDVFLTAVERGVADPLGDFNKEGMLFNYATYFLSKWREHRAYPLFVRWLSLPGEQALELGGDTVTTDGGRFLACVCDGDPEPIKALIANRQAHEACRGQGIRALALLVAWGEQPRDEVEKYFLALAREGLPREKGQVWNHLALACVTLEFLSVFPELRRACQEGLLDPRFLSVQDLDTVERSERGELVKEFAERHPPISDVIAETRWWAGFQRGPAAESAEGSARRSDLPYVAPEKVGRNDPCPCGSGKKYKKCCGAK